jgi:hypothetical protein
LPQTGFLPSLPLVAQRFFRFHQSLQDFHQPLHGLIRRLKEFLQPLKEATRSLHGFIQPLRGFIQRFFGFHQSLRDVWQRLKDANQPSFTLFWSKTHIYPQISQIGADFSFFCENPRNLRIKN